MAEMPSIVLRGVDKEYRRDEFRIPVLVDLDLSVDEGEFLALMGPSGSGKTTLLNLIAGLDRATRGEVIVHGQDLGELSEAEITRWRANNVGFIFQTYNLIPVLTAFENVELPLLLTHLSRRKRRENVMTALRIVGLAGREHHYPRQLSGGQEQRVAIARAIVTDPYLLVADEPTGDLDRATAGEILDLLEQLNREFQKTIVMVTHDPLAAQRATRILHLDKGRLGRRRRERQHDIGRVMKYLTYILRNARRNPVRSILTIASMAICLFLTMTLLSFFAIFDEAFSSTKIYNRVMTLNSNGFAGMIPIARVKEMAGLEGVVAATPFSWFGGKYQDEIMPFAQFGVDPDVDLRISWTSSRFPPSSSRRSRKTRTVASSAASWPPSGQLNVGDSLPLKGDAFPIDLEPEDRRHLRRALQPRPADVPVSFRLF